MTFSGNVVKAGLAVLTTVNGAILEEKSYFGGTVVNGVWKKHGGGILGKESFLQRETDKEEAGMGKLASKAER